MISRAFCSRGNQQVTVGQRWVAVDEKLSPSASKAQAAVIGAHTVLVNHKLAGQSGRLRFNDTGEPRRDVSKDSSDALLEEDVLHGNDHRGMGVG